MKGGNAMRAILKVVSSALPKRILKRIIEKWLEIPEPGTVIPFGKGIGQGVVTDVEVHIRISAPPEAFERIQHEQANDWQEIVV